MKDRLTILNLLCVNVCCLCCFSTISAVDAAGKEQGVHCTVEVEEVVTRYTPANNGAGPLWCYGSTVIARQGGNIYLSVIETGKNIPLLCNTRWQLWHRSADGWKLEQAEKEYRQREPCPLAVFQGGPVFLSVNGRVYELSQTNESDIATATLSDIEEQRLEMIYLLTLPELLDVIEEEGTFSEKAIVDYRGFLKAHLSSLSTARYLSSLPPEYLSLERLIGVIIGKGIDGGFAFLPFGD